jgi:hypothetical protein
MPRFIMNGIGCRVDLMSAQDKWKSALALVRRSRNYSLKAREKAYSSWWQQRGRYVDALCQAFSFDKSDNCSRCPLRGKKGECSADFILINKRLCELDTASNEAELKTRQQAFITAFEEGVQSMHNKTKAFIES